MHAYNRLRTNHMESNVYCVEITNDRTEKTTATKSVRLIKGFNKINLGIVDYTSKEGSMYMEMSPAQAREVAKVLNKYAARCEKWDQNEH